MGARRVWPWLALLACAMSTAPASAAEQGAARARALFERAERRFKVGEVAPALALYQRAYRADPLPGFLFNIGQCHRHLGRCDRAIPAYRRFLARAPRTRHRETVERVIALCKAQLATRVPPRPPAADAGHLARRIAELEADLARVRRRPRPAPFYKRWWFWTAVGATVVSVVVTTAAVGYGSTDDPMRGNASPGIFRLPLGGR